MSDEVRESDTRQAVRIDPSRLVVGRPAYFTMAGVRVMALKRDNGDVDFYHVLNEDSTEWES